MLSFSVWSMPLHSLEHFGGSTGGRDRDVRASKVLTKCQLQEPRSVVEEDREMKGTGISETELHI